MTRWVAVACLVVAACAGREPEQAPVVRASTVVAKTCTRDTMIANLKRRGCWRVESRYQPQPRTARFYDACDDQISVRPLYRQEDVDYEYWDCDDVDAFIRVPLQ